MADLRKRFGELLAAHRRRRRLTQDGLAEAAGLSVDMISKIEAGSTGASFTSIERLARAVQVDPAELFTSDLPTGSFSRGAYAEITTKLSSLPESDLAWINTILEAVMLRGQAAGSKRTGVKTLSKPGRPAVSAKKPRV
jgi:transcriptional regulator with XRE-family HTH domain